MRKKNTADRRSLRLENTSDRDVLQGAWLLASTLTAELISMIEAAVQTPAMDDGAWEQVFGNKETAVGHLHKLVGILATIAKHVEDVNSPEDARTHELALTDADYVMLKRWLEKEVGTKTDG